MCHRFFWWEMEIDKPPVKCHKEQFPVAAVEVEDNMYVDDLDTGADDVESTASLRKHVTEMKKGGFHIRKWASNCGEVMETTPVDDCLPEMINESEEKQQEKQLWSLHETRKQIVCFTMRLRMPKRNQ